MSILWPVTLPQKPLRRGFSESAPKQLLRTQMDVGPAKIRRRFTAAVRPFAIILKLTSAQVQIFDDFYNEDCAAGSLPFSWTHPRTGAAATFRFAGDEPPSYVPGGGDWWTITFNLELMP
ncbi:MAG: hypothetical protein OET90_02575 [Desulfuromonadales bacterium]|nr:hypothetical protein [Desulfuromonadales bacterium]